MKVVEIQTTGNPKGAKYLHELADKIESGEIRDCVVVFDNHTKKCFESFVEFSDRWRLLGALEYAKQQVHEN